MNAAKHDAVKATLGEKRKPAALLLLLSVSDLDAVQARKIYGKIFTERQDTKQETTFTRREQETNLISEYIPTAALSRYAEEKK